MWFLLGVAIGFVGGVVTAWQVACRIEFAAKYAARFAGWLAAKAEAGGRDA